MAKILFALVLGIVPIQAATCSPLDTVADGSLPGKFKLNHCLEYARALAKALWDRNHIPSQLGIVVRGQSQGAHAFVVFNYQGQEYVADNNTVNAHKIPSRFNARDLRDVLWVGDHLEWHVAKAFAFPSQASDPELDRLPHY